MRMAPVRTLNIVHVFRAPVGGLFRHVLDLARGQIARGHRVGLIADSSTGGTRAEQILAELAPRLALGLERLPMRQMPGPWDIAPLLATRSALKRRSVDVAHGHGAKGGAFVRLALGATAAVRAYTPHGGSLHYGRDTVTGKLYLATERLLARRCELYLFESEFSAGVFGEKIGKPQGMVSVVHNGVAPAEFEPVTLAGDATDLLFLGELRHLKGVDVLIEALALLKQQGRGVTATLVGAGPDEAALRVLIAARGLDEIRILPPMPARQAFALGRNVVVPSRAESLPYVVLEAAAGGKPLITTAVGGIPEIYGPLAETLIPPGDAAALAATITRSLASGEASAALAAKLRQRVADHFSVETMVEGVLAAYAAAVMANAR
jgi:glycosyltransferase involved in cell wall biosynthesis